MKVELEIWHLFLLFMAFCGCVWAFGKVLMDQFEKRMDERFAAIGNAQAEIQRLERGLLELRAELPMRFVMRDDYIRGQTVIEAKVDTLGAKFDNLQLRIGAKE